MGYEKRLQLKNDKKTDMKRPVTFQKESFRARKAKKQQIREKKLTFNIMYYPVSQNVGKAKTKFCYRFDNYKSKQSIQKR